MNRAPIEREVAALTALPGVRGAALLDLEGGLPWAAGGEAAALLMAEAASDHWRLTLRHGSTFGALGALRTQVLIHAEGRLTLVACPLNLLLVTVSAEPDTVDWRHWKSGVGRLHAVLRAA